MAECPRCGADNPEGSAYCGLCADRLAAPAPPAPPAAAEPESVSPAGSYLPAREKRKRQRFTLIAALALALVLAAAVVVISISGKGESAHGPEKLAAFASGTSGLTFNYPASWEKKDQQYLRSISNGDFDLAQANELVLLKTGDAIYRHLLLVSTPATSPDARKWPQVKQQMQDSLAQGAQSQESRLSFFDLALPQARRAVGFGMMYWVGKASDPSTYELQAFILKGQTIYTFRLITPLKGGGSDEQGARARFDALINSVGIR